jgi:hypothetical protein
MAPKNLLLRWKRRLRTTNQAASGLAGLAGERVDKRSFSAGNVPPPSAETDRTIGFELKIKFAIAASAQPVVFNRLACTSCSHHANDSAVAQVIQLFAACRVDAFGQHLRWLLTQQIFSPTTFGCEFWEKVLSRAIGPFA